VRDALGRRGVRGRERLANRFFEAVRVGDADRMAELTVPDLSLSVRSAEGDLRAQGDDARRELVAIGSRAFGTERALSESWSTVAGREAVVVLVSAVRHGGTRVDLSWSLLVRGGLVVDVALIAAGSVDGRPLGAL
jgi:hypothetical protein